jgi:hypothetical protein
MHRTENLRRSTGRRRGRNCAALRTGELAAWVNGPMNQRGQGFLYSPAEAKALSNTLAGDADALRPFANSQRLSTACYQPRLPRVAELLFLRGPAAVARLVVAVVVDAIERVASGRPWAYVSEERHEIVPLTADTDAATAVVVVLRVALVAAALFHAVPHYVLGGSGEAVSAVHSKQYSTTNVMKGWL